MALIKQTFNHSTPAAKLHGAYNRITQGKSDFKFWSDAAKKVDFDDAMMAIRYIEKNYSLYPKLTITKLRELITEARQDPVAARYPVSISARTLADEIAMNATPIDAEYVQQALDEYRNALDIINEISTDLWIRLPAPIEFVRNWFEQNSNLATRHRRFSAASNRFWKDLQTIAQVWKVTQGHEMAAIHKALRARFS
jgi:hypothetical protein